MIVRTIQYPRLKTTNKVNIQSDYKHEIYHLHKIHTDLFFSFLFFFLFFLLIIYVDIVGIRVHG